MSKPPLPSSRPADTLRLCLLFWVELLGAFLALIALYVFLEKQIGKGAVLTFTILAGTAFLVATGRLVRRAIQLRNGKGPMRERALAAFWAALVLPALVLAGAWQLRPQNEEHKARQMEAQAALQELFEKEQAFKRDFGRFTFNVKELGYGEPEGVRAYVVGFPTACSVKEGGTLEKSRVLFSEYVPSEQRRLQIEQYLLDAREAADCKDPREAFEAYAVGVLKENAPLDVWRIDETGKLDNLQKGY